MYDDYFEQALRKEIAEVESLTYSRLTMKCTKKDFLLYISEWLNDLTTNTENEEDLAYHKEFYCSQIYKKKYSPLV